MRRVALMAVVVMLAGCAIGSPKYSCPAPGHGVCKSISSVYADPVQDRPTKKDTNQSSTKTLATPPAAGADATALRFGTFPYVGVTPGEPLRREARVLRIWVAPWVDKYGDWNDQSYLYVLQDRGGWRVDESLQGVMSGKKEIAAGDTPP